MGRTSSIGTRALYKASWHILPLLGLGYLFSYLDRINVSFAATQMNVDLGFSATVYGLGGGFFFLTYALLEVPSGMIMPRIGARRWVARIIISWGLISAGMMFVRTPLEFYVMRLLLGAAEAGFWPTCIYYMANWYPKPHRGRAVSRFYCFGGITAIVGGTLSGWLLGLDGAAALRGWQWLFLVEGLPTVMLGIAMFRLLPDSPQTARWLKDEEREWIIRRLAAENMCHGPVSHANPLRSLGNPMVLQLAVIGCLTIGAYIAFALIAPQVLMAATGLDIVHVGYLVSVGGVMTILGMLASGWHSDRLGSRFSHLIGSMVLVAACFAAMSFAKTPATMIAAYLAMSLFWPAVTLSTCLVVTEVVPAWMVAVAMAAVNTLSQLGAFVAPTLWGISKDATGSYHFGVTLVPLAFLAAAAIGLNLRFQMQNRGLASRARALAA
jgi:ACS family tartrate transporter-like MFS transporter